MGVRVVLDVCIRMSWLTGDSWPPATGKDIFRPDLGKQRILNFKERSLMFTFRIKKLPGKLETFQTALHISRWVLHQRIWASSSQRHRNSCNRDPTKNACSIWPSLLTARSDLHPHPHMNVTLSCELSHGIRLSQKLTRNDIFIVDSPSWNTKSLQASTNFSSCRTTWTASKEFWSRITKSLSQNHSEQKCSIPDSVFIVCWRMRSKRFRCQHPEHQSPIHKLQLHRLISSEGTLRANT